MRYNPLQIPYILNKEFSTVAQYGEETDGSLEDHLICFWEISPKSEKAKTVTNVIVTDGCIDLVADFNHRQIGFVGMSKTNFEFKITMPCHYTGARLKPGAFHALTGLPATAAMDRFLPLEVYDRDFDAGRFFSLPPDQAKAFFKDYVKRLAKGKSTNDYLLLFDRHCDNIPDSTAELYKELNYSAKQTERLFAKHYGLTPQEVLCILRFQKCAGILASAHAKPSDVLNAVNYCDQAHFIKDFKKHIGLTPFELVNRYR
jgi:AraC-like DNA-binding protein